MTSLTRSTYHSRGSKTGRFADVADTKSRLDINVGFEPGLRTRETPSAATRGGRVQPMVEVHVVVPEDRVAELYAAAAELAKPQGAHSAPPAPPELPWSDEALARLNQTLLDEERDLLLRIAEARGRRVPLSRLADDLGLPAEACIEQDFPALTAFCADPAAPRAMPVVAGGSGQTVWYWMPPVTSRRFLKLTDAELMAPG
jgi:hypothetical protein